MSNPLTPDQLPPGLAAGDYVELTIDEFRNGYDTFSAGLVEAVSSSKRH